ncbi:Gfo/Idh/MocA family oxidoreductase [bacterium]|nr:Gfo/Idh/MocA family oxidoreductase [bacterium]
MSERKTGASRRKFMGIAAGTAFAAAATPLVKSASAQTKTGKKLKVALVGTGIRGSGTWGKPLIDNYSDIIEFVGLCDRNPKRMEFVQQYLGLKCPLFIDTDFDTMIEKTRPDRVIVTTMDCFHAKYICRAMELGCDVITEKPLCTDEKMCQQIMDTEKRTGRHIRVTFNYRYGPAAARVKEILMSGEIGRITSVDFSYYLNTDHGASYYRRWHGYKQNSGSLLVHKATHHFDLLNWWLDAEPMMVNAHGDLRHYGFNSPFRGERCMTCQHKKTCPFFWDITTNEFLMNLYVKPETEDGYIRDHCLFSEDINIWDTMSVQVRYHNDVLLNYSLNSCMPYEGYLVGFNGTKGRLDAREYHQQPWEVDRLADIRVTRIFGDSRLYTVPNAGPGHWGADEKMQDMIFRGPIPDPLHQTAGSRAGALSIMIGVTARRSIEQQRPIAVEELVKI